MEAGLPRKVATTWLVLAMFISSTELARVLNPSRQDFGACSLTRSPRIVQFSWNPETAGAGDRGPCSPCGTPGQVSACGQGSQATGGHNQSPYLLLLARISRHFGAVLTHGLY